MEWFFFSFAVVVINQILTERILYSGFLEYNLLHIVTKTPQGKRFLFMGMLA